MKNKKYYDKNKVVLDFKVNDLVLVRQAKNVPLEKMKFEGPFRVARRLNETTYLIYQEDRIEQIHSRRMIPYVSRPGKFQSEPPILTKEILNKLDE